MKENKISKETIGLIRSILKSKRKPEETQMETKSRYEVIAELEEKKRSLIKERDGLQDQVRAKEREIKLAKRDIEDAEEALKDYKDSLEEKKATITELIKSVDDSLERFSKLTKDSKS